MRTQCNREAPGGTFSRLRLKRLACQAIAQKIAPSATLHQAQVEFRFSLKTAEFVDSNDPVSVADDGFYALAVGI